MKAKLVAWVLANAVPGCATIGCTEPKLGDLPPGPIRHHERARIQGNPSTTARPADEKGSGQKGASCGGHNPQPPLSIGGKCQACTTDIIRRQIGKIAENFVGGHSRGEVFQHISDGDPQSADARLPAPLIRLDRDQLRVIHK